MNIHIYVDGLVEPVNPQGHGCFGWVVYETDPPREVYAARGYIGHGKGVTNNVAEYRALLAAAQWIGEHYPPTFGQTIAFFSDSQLLVNHINGSWQCNYEHLRVLRDEARTLLKPLGATLTWIPREQNERADQLSRQAYFEQTGQQPRDRTKPWKRY